ncbi:YebG family protein [Alteromonas facilis]|uniref:YebG family protein n=1 Tax=Alteromonas facilis TaxID=2048004 RepID=UPI000C28D86F|nr:YebG family protein [Alteromonas facilis]
MAITIQYVVTYKGVEKLVTTDKKAADQYDKMLDIADNLQTYLKVKLHSLDEQALEDLAFTLAQEKNAITKLFKGNDAQTILNEEGAEVLPLNKASNA